MLFRQLRHLPTGIVIALVAAASAGCERGAGIASEAAPDLTTTSRSSRAAALPSDGEERATDRAQGVAARKGERVATAGDPRARAEEADGGQRADGSSGGERGNDRDGDHGGIDADGDPRPAEGDDEQDSPAPEGAAAQLHAAMRALVRDLEFSSGLREPPQQAVVPPPPAWTPAPGADTNPKPFIDGVRPAGAPASGGVPVVIHGRNLQAAQVLFGMAPARILDSSEDEVTVTAPAGGAGEVAIVVTNQDGNYAIAAAPFRYYH